MLKIKVAEEIEFHCHQSHLVRQNQIQNADQWKLIIINLTIIVCHSHRQTSHQCLQYRTSSTSSFNKNGMAKLVNHSIK